MTHPLLAPGGFSPVEVKCLNDAWENAIRSYGIINACEWFGWSRDSDIVGETLIHFIKIADTDKKTKENKL